MFVLLNDQKSFVNVLEIIKFEFVMNKLNISVNHC